MEPRKKLKPTKTSALVSGVEDAVGRADTSYAE